MEYRHNTTFAVASATCLVIVVTRFQELPDGTGTVHGVLHFDDSKTGNFVLQGGTTTSPACHLTVKTFLCTAQHAITVAGTYTQKGKTAGDYLLTLSGAGKGIGTFTLTAGDQTYTLMHNGIVDVNCPPVVGVIAGQQRLRASECCQ
jgi:hypothetical protein